MAEQNNYDALMDAAKKKLDFQKREENIQEETEPEDIYAEFMEESDEEGLYDSEGNKTLPNINAGSKTLPDITPEYEKDDYYVDPNDTPVFEGGPGISKVQLWKQEYGIDRVFHVKVLDKHFVFRTLNRAEYEQIAALALDSLTNEEVICKTCVLWPFEYDYNKMGKDNAGYPSTLSQIIMENSGFTTEYGIEVL